MFVICSFPAKHCQNYRKYISCSFYGEDTRVGKNYYK